MATVTVLVCFQATSTSTSRNREVTFRGSKAELIENIKVVFADLLLDSDLDADHGRDKRLILQVLDERWNV
jgi:hypothetical protein